MRYKSRCEDCAQISQFCNEIFAAQVGQTCPAGASTGPAGTSVTAGGGPNPIEPFIRAVRSS